MSQKEITTYYTYRKRPATDDIVSSKSKIRHIELDTNNKSQNEVQMNNEISINNIKQASLVSNETITKELEDDSVSAQRPSSEEQDKKEPTLVKSVNGFNIPKPKGPSKSEILNKARKELSLGDIRKQLSRSSRLAEIKATAERLGKRIPELLQTVDKKNLKEFKTIDLEVPSKPSTISSVKNELLSPKSKDVDLSSTPQRPLISPRKVIVSPIKSPSKVSAYLKQISPATSSTSLPLPHQYKLLFEIFRSIETVVSLLYNRNEKITFSKLKPSVQEMLKRNFTKKHLAQIKYLVPDFYTFELEKIKNFNTTCHKETFELVISPVFPKEINLMNPSVLLERRRYFHNRLMQIVKKHHAQFLLTLEVPMVIPDEKLIRWHPEFDLEKVPEIESAKLPENTNVEKFSTAQDVLTKARELFKCNTKMERAMEKLVQAKARGLTDQEKVVTGIGGENTKINNGTQTDKPSTSAITILNPALRNLPASLLEKVKAKQAAKALEAMTRSTAHENEYLVYSRLPDLARTLRNIYVTERKNVLALNIILSKLDISFKSNVTSSDLYNDIKKLTEVAPNWVKLHIIRNTTYLKLDRNADLKEIISKLESLAAKYKE